jgi:hypothetical protein
MRPLESLLVKQLDELRKRSLPGFLLVVVELPELPGIHPKLSRHLNLFVAQTMTPFCLNPGNQFLRNFGLTHHSPLPHLM